MASTKKEVLEGNYFVSTYPPFSSWQKGDQQSLDDVLSETAANGTPLGMYIHIPFCVKRCNYCYYLSTVCGSYEERDVYLEAVASEISLYASKPYFKDHEVDFLYFGGGTPSILEAVQIDFIFKKIKSEFTLKDNCEITFECAPGSIDYEKLAMLHEHGVTRISMGVQQYNDDILEKSGRVHRIEDICQAYENIRKFDFDIVNLDLIAGLPGETETTFFESLDKVMAMDSESVTVYQLEIPLNTALHKQTQEKDEWTSMSGWDVKRSRADRAFTQLESHGWSVRSAYAAVKDPQKHIFKYQELQYKGCDLLGVGASSFSYINGFHHQNIAPVKKYKAAVSNGELPSYRSYKLSRDEKIVREFALQMKLGRVDFEYFRKKYSLDPLVFFAEPLEYCVQNDWAEIGDDAFVLTRPGLLRVDNLIPGFYLAEHQNIRYS